MHSCSRPTVSEKDLREAVADLQSVDFWVGFRRVGILGATLLLTIALAWNSTNEVLFWGWTAVSGLVYLFLMICIHDALHHTLLGWPCCEDILARVIAWPMLWPMGVYAELHRLHHGWNGLDLRDPERVQWTATEYHRASRPLQWYIRHQWIIDLLVSGGVGLIAKTFLHGRRLQHLLPRLKFQLFCDVIGMLFVQTIIVTCVVVTQASLWRYILFWICLERIIGTIGQVRTHIEHYGLWKQVGGHQLTQLYACRNLNTSALVSWLMGGLNYHAVHHAFPGVPFNQLATAHQRIQTIFSNHNMPAMEVQSGYLKTTFQLMQHMSLIA